jgi:hypothetical protein
MTSEENKVSLTDSSVGGKLVGRDDHSITISTPQERSIYLDDLYNRFVLEKETNEELKEICEELDYFNSQIDGEQMVGLESKLIAGHKPQAIIDYAKIVKERFHKKLFKTSQYSLVAQDVNVYILSKVRRSFMTEIYTLISKGENDEKINALITERIINPVKADLGVNLFKYTEDDIMGMIFFLTGNCHIKWTP